MEDNKIETSRYGWCVAPPVDEDKYSIWIELEDISEKEWHDINLKNYVDSVVSESTVDSELIYKINVIITKARRIKELAIYLDDDITIYGCDQDVIASIRLMQKLGLL